MKTALRLYTSSPDGERLFSINQSIKLLAVYSDAALSDDLDQISPSIILIKFILTKNSSSMN